MNLKIILIGQVFSFVLATQKNVFLVSYFSYKRTSYVVGFSCNNAQGDLNLIKNFSNIGIFSSLQELHANFTIKPFLYTSYKKLGIVMDLRCHNDTENKNIMSKASIAGLYGELHYWLILGKDLNESVKVLNDTEYSLSTDIILAIEDKEEFILYDVFNHCKHRGGLLNITIFGSWCSSKGLNVTLTQSKFRRRANLHGMLLKTAALVTNRPKHMRLEEYLQDFSRKKKDIMQKFAYSVLLHLADLYNFTMQTQELTAWNPTNKNGPMVKMLSNRSIDLGVNTGIITADRLATLVPMPIWPLRTCFIFRTAQPKQIKVNHFLNPLAKATWYLTIVLIVVAILVFAWVLISEHISDKFERYSVAFLFTIGSLCQQGSDLQPTHLSSRIAFLQTMVFSLLIYNYYSASVVSTRLNEAVEKINDSLNELAKTSLKFGAEPSLHFNIFIKRSDWEAQQFYYKRWVQIPDNEKFMSAEVGIKRILKEDFAFHIDVNTAYPIIEKSFPNQQICQLTRVHLIRPTDTFMFLPLNSSFIELLRVGLVKIRETGLRIRLIKRWSARVPECRTDIYEMEPVNIYEAAPAFILVLCGIVLAVIIFNIEKIIYCKNSHDNGIKIVLSSIKLKICSLKIKDHRS